MLSDRAGSGGVMLTLIALVILAGLALFVFVVLLDVLRRLFWFALRLGAAVAAAFAGGATAFGLAPVDLFLIAIPVALACGAAMLRLSRGWGRVDETPLPRTATTRSMPDMSWSLDPPTPPSSVTERPIAAGVAARHPASLAHGALVDPVLAGQLDATEQALAHAARDDVGFPAAEWLAFWRERVPDLIASARDVWDDADAVERAEVAGRLSDQLRDVIAEAERRIAIVRAARRDRFTTRANHAAARVREG